ncbi:hypothetical protein [Rhizobium sp. Root1204]|uniref:hypothetical protein n=1 Tax=Rhizobium sp. Root1204 TaxID=1736428 RepID=UPI000712ABED|nr:hypothetical protein [Rhizobium sp. Root1204]KQV31152.1 hypothetical protein ASC96_08145 [Rhizobium sp. Root1204]
MVRAVDATTSAYVQARKGVIPRNFVWISAKNRETGAVESAGFWNGLDTVDVTVISGTTGEEVTRTYTAWGSLLKIDPIQRSPEITIRTIKLTLSQISPAVQQLFRGYDTRLAPIEIHRGFLDLDSHLIIAPPVIRFIGWINKAPIMTPIVKGEGSVTVDVVSHSRMLTRTNTAKRSDESQKLRSGDRFRRYSSVADQWDFWWGEKRGKIDAVVKTATKEVFKKGS